MSKKAKRLYEQFRPEHYELTLSLDKRAMTFRGTVSISGRKVGRPSQRITFHQKSLSVTKATLTKRDKHGESPVEIDRINHQASLNEVRLHTGTILYPGEYTVSLDFRGKITPSLQGIYPSNFKHEGKDKIVLVTQFESHYARDAFPCIDEPEAKATFELTLVTDANETVLSNTPIRSQDTADKVTTTSFEVTPRMSTYLLAFAVGELHCVEAKTKDGVLVRTWATVARPKAHLEYSNREAIAVLEFFTDYYGVPYPLKKLDQLALPDFHAGAMENWGMVTYREVILLADPDNRSISGEQLATLVIAHELSHQWFGNLVTMKWWDDLWLNESFAGLMEHMAPAALHPEWQEWELYAISDIALITSKDVYKDIQAVGVELTDPDLIDTLFDPAIVYAKGARLIKMLREYIGDDMFVEGLGAYFKKHAYSNATRNDLWAALSEASGQDIEKLMTPWLTQPGMPVVHVSQRGKSMKVAQERFLLDGKPDDTLWPIPLLADKPTAPELFNTSQAAITLDEDSYVLVNQYGSGQYLTHYTEPQHIAHLAQTIASGRIPAEARINLLNDMYMLARHGDAPLTDALNVIAKCADEPRDSVWGMIIRSAGAAFHLTEGDKTAEIAIKRLEVGLANGWYGKLGWDDKPNDDPNTKQLRHSMISLMIAGEDKAAIGEALKRYKSAKQLINLPAELRNTILAAGVKHGTPDIPERLLKEYPLASPDLQMDITSGLTATRDAKLAKNIVSKALGKGGFVRSQDVLRWLALFLRNRYTRQVIWDYMVKDWVWLEETLASSKSFDYLPTYAASVITTDEWGDKYRALFEPKLKNKTLQRNIKLGLADIEARIAWRKRDEKLIKDWLTKNT